MPKMKFKRTLETAKEDFAQVMEKLLKDNAPPEGEKVDLSRKPTPRTEWTKEEWDDER